ncbi:MAG: imidazole glycerol phosphate synthase subunit HisH [Candidatus Pacebacteria bacterium]|nr:imidazole glycerol phosphate synthase subunit HisH [Candidatus Paceibacterota bacterium]
MSLVIIDSGSGNLRSVQKSLESTRSAGQRGESITVSSDPRIIAAASRLVLPGQGAFRSVALGLESHEGLMAAMTEAVIGRGVPLLGICVGMQIMVTSGRENGNHRGLGWLSGECLAIAPAVGIKIPHMGWNNLSLTAQGRGHPLLRGIADGDHAYFVHSYVVDLAEPSHLLATCEVGPGEDTRLTAMIGRDNICGTQFHVEKSQATGLKILENFWQWTP